MKKILLFALAALLLVAFTAPAMAATKKVSFYGDIRFNTYWVNKDSDYFNNYQNMADKSDNDLMWEADFGDSRFGARFMEGPISANVEIRPKDKDYGGYRQWWGQWDFGPAAILVGHTWNPACITISNSQFDSETGVFYGSFMSRLRTTQIRLTVPFSMGKLVIGLLNNPAVAPDVVDSAKIAATGSEPKASDYTIYEEYNDDLKNYNAKVAEYDFDHPRNYDTDVKMPEIETCLTLKFSPVQVDLVGAYSRFKYEEVISSTSETVTSYFYGTRLIVPFGPFSFKALYICGQNLGNYGDLSTLNLNYTKMRWDVATDKSEDSDYSDYGATLGFKVNDMVSLEAGYFYQKTERYQKEEDPNAHYYLMAAITPVKGFTIYPEIGVRDEKDITDSSGKTRDQGKRKYFGAYWKISF